MDGILNVNKPEGETSFGVVARIRRLTGERRVGHGGTLDPLATGVLPVCLGRGTRVVEFLVDATKEYQARIQLGVVTDTYDAAGRVTQRGDASAVRREQLEAALASFRGVILQTPPMYSALKYRGKRLYELARAGVEVERKSRPVEIHQMELMDWQPPVVTVKVVSGKGTYIRSLAHDLGQALGCGASLAGLVRSRYGLFHLADAVSLSQLEYIVSSGYWQHLVYPVDVVLSHWPAVVVSEANALALRNGRPLDFADGSDASGATHSGRCRAYGADGLFLAVLRYSAAARQWLPEKVFGD
ncbi:MAG: tRNA pseudouridine(55) synthase TruB [Chloroflexota bacterium]